MAFSPPLFSISTISIQAHILSSCTQTSAVVSQRGSLLPLLSAVQFPPQQLEEGSSKRTISQILLPPLPTPSFPGTLPGPTVGLASTPDSWPARPCMTSSDPAPHFIVLSPDCSLNFRSTPVPLLLDHCIQTGLWPGLRDHSCLWIVRFSSRSCHSVILRLILFSDSKVGEHMWLVLRQEPRAQRTVGPQLSRPVVATHRPFGLGSPPAG